MCVILNESYPHVLYFTLDNLGRAGLCKHPFKLHFHKLLPHEFARFGISTQHTPPNGPLFAAIELTNGTVQAMVRRCSQMMLIVAVAADTTVAVAADAHSCHC